MNNNTLKEFEHKYEITEDMYEFTAALCRPGSIFTERDNIIEVGGVDHYFTGVDDYVFRFRDGGLQELTVKSDDADTESRMEVNLVMVGASLEAVSIFMNTLGLAYAGSIHKEGFVNKRDDHEVTVYKAWRSDNDVRYFLEVEAYGDDEEVALNAIAEAESRLGFDPATRVKEQLFSIMSEEVGNG